MSNWDDCKGFTTICRLCLHRDGFMLGIFNRIQGMEKSIYKKIIDCTSLKISFDDGLPSCICHRCLYKIEFCLEFQQQCIKSDEALRQDNGITLLTNTNKDQEECNVVMVVDPRGINYDSEYESDSNENANDNVELNEIYQSVFMCKFCDQAFTDESSCTYHENNNHCHKTPYVCSICNLRFTDRIQLSSHLKSIHQHDKPYNCPECDRAFARRSDLRKHTIVHTGIKPFICKICFKSFSRNTNLSKHMRIHSGKKPYVCQKCPKTFTSKGDLTRHTIIHSGCKSFTCKYCQLTFGRKDKLIKHESKHVEANIDCINTENQGNVESIDETNDSKNNETNSNNNEWSNSENMVINLDPFNHSNFDNLENQYLESNLSDTESPSETATPFESLTNIDEDSSKTLPHIPEHIVGDSYSIVNSTTNHVNRYQNSSNNERNHFCNICKKAFVRKRELDRHILTHTGMKPFKCSNCDKRFGRKDKLIRHMHIHDINRGHVCKICWASFNRKDTLTYHMKKHVKEENAN